MILSGFETPAGQAAACRPQHAIRRAAVQGLKQPHMARRAGGPQRTRPAATSSWQTDSCLDAGVDDAAASRRGVPLGGEQRDRLDLAALRNQSHRWRLDFPEIERFLGDRDRVAANTIASV